MTSSNSERVTCPSCDKAYRWQPTLVGQSVPCKQCGTTFTIPDQPGKGIAHQPEPVDDDGLYELATDPDDEPVLPPARAMPPPIEQYAPPPATAPAQSSEASEPNEDPDQAEPQLHISEAAKAARREEQRIAAAEQQAARSWRDYKWLIIVLSLLGLFAVIYLAMYLFSDAMEEETMRQQPAEVFVMSDAFQSADSHE